MVESKTRRAAVLWMAAAVAGFLAGSPAASQETGQIELVQLEQHVRRIAAHASSSVVTVVSVHSFPRVAPVPGAGPGTLLPANGSGQGRLEATVGSGVVIDAAGFVVTTASVIGEGGEYQINTASGDVWSAELVGYDRATKLCLLRTRASDLPPIEMGNSKGLSPGTMVIIVGRAYGNLPTVSFGAMGDRHPWRGSEGTELMSMSAPVYPGNCGGAVVDFSGRLIGIVSGALGGLGDEVAGSIMRIPPEPGEVARAGQGAQMSFAIPVEALKGAVPRLKSGSGKRSGYLGVRVASASPGEGAFGVVISDVVPMSPAESAGLRGGDMILKFDGKEVRSAHELVDMVRRTSHGKAVKIVFQRGGRTLSTSVVLSDISPIELKLVEKRMSHRR